jgi:RNase P/RNase MRP subunit p29
MSKEFAMKGIVKKEYTLLFWKPEGKKPLGKPVVRVDGTLISK